jgi:tRNA threonylcarbamoyladenosine biosynthesis protein TsaB
VELSIDTSTRYASVAVSRQGEIAVELAWRSEQNHSVELVPALNSVMERARVTVDDLDAVFVTRGPGGFSALRVGMSFAKSLAMSGRVPLVGIGTLDVEAQPYLGLGRPVCAALEAGRQAVYVAVYDGSLGHDERPAGDYRVAALDELASAVGDGMLVCGEAAPAVVNALREQGHRCTRAVDAPPPTRRPAHLAALGYRRYAEGQTDSPEDLQPVYMRGSQVQRAQGPRASSG